MNEIKLSDAGEEAWATFRRHVEWSTGFAFLLLFSSNQAVAELFEKRLEDLFRFRVAPLQKLVPSTPDELPRWLESLGSSSHHGPLWFDLSRQRGDGWEEAVRNFIGRLNERREAVRSKVGRPLILVLPAAFRATFAALAPDLWAIREFSLDLSTFAQPQERSQDRPTSHAEPKGFQRDTGRSDDDASESLIEEWRRLKTEAAQGPGVLRTSLRASEAARSVGRLEDAYAIAHHAVSLARAAHARVDSPEAIRDLSISLDRVGDVASALGRLEEADAAYRESLNLMRLQRSRLGDTPETVRNLSISLDNVGDIASALGRLEEADAAYRESLDLIRLQRSRLGDTPETVRDLSVSLNRVGDVASALGHLEEADAAYRESLDLMRLQRTRLGDTPETVRDLSISLNKVGDVASGLGRLEEADAAYRESLDLIRLQRSRLGDTPETIRDLSVSLDNVGDAASALGRLEEADAAYRESLDLRRLQRTRLGDTPETVRDLCIALKRVGDVATALGRLEEADAAYRESLDLSRRLALAFPEVAEHQKRIQFLEKKLWQR